MRVAVFLSLISTDNLAYNESSKNDKLEEEGYGIFN